MKSEVSIAQDGLPPKQRRWAVVTVGLAIFMTVIDQTIVNVALPTFQKAFDVTELSTVAWSVTGYTLALAAVIVIVLLAAVVVWRQSAWSAVSPK